MSGIKVNIKSPIKIIKEAFRPTPQTQHFLKELRRNLSLDIRYTQEVLRDIGWLVLKAPWYGENLRLLMTAEGGRHMYTKHKMIALELLARFQGGAEISVYDDVDKIRGQPSPENPLNITFGVLGPDWEGMLDAIAGVIHEKGFNIAFASSLSIEKPGLGFTAIEIMLTSAEKLNFLKNIKSEIRKDLEIAAIKDIWKMLLQKKNTRKYIIYEKCKRILISAKKENLLNELGKFFWNRPDVYLEARRPEDLVRQIADNFTRLQYVRAHREEAAVRVRNLLDVPGQRWLTAISLAADPKKVSLEDILDSLEYLFPGYNYVTDYSFFTTDQLALYRVEFIKSDGRPLAEGERSNLEKELQKIKEKRPLIKVHPGMEPEIRLINILREEYEKTKIVQVQISPMGIIDFRYLPFRVILVAAPGKGQAVYNQLLKSEDIMVSSWISPRSYKDKRGRLMYEVTLMNLSIPSKEEDPYKLITAQVEKVTPVRVLDKTLRTLDGERFKAVIAALEDKKELSETFIAQFYLTMPEPYRYEVPLEEICEQIVLAHELSKLRKLTLKPYESQNRRYIGITFPFAEKWVLSQCHDIFKKSKLNPLITRINTFENISVAVYSFTKEKSISPELWEELLKKIRQSCTNVL